MNAQDSNELSGPPVPGWLTANQTTGVGSDAPSNISPPLSLSRADIAEYMERNNWDPIRARALATHETLTNLGVHPDVAAQVAGSVVQSATPVSSAPQGLSAPIRALPLKRLSAPPSWVPTPIAPRLLTNPSGKSGRHEVDLSAGFVPRSSVEIPKATGADDGIDLSAGFVPLNAPPVSPKTTSVRPTQPSTSPSATKAIDFSDLGGKRVNAASQQLDFSDLGGKRVEEGLFASPDATPASSTDGGNSDAQPEPPGFLERAYETSGLKSLIDAAKAKTAEDEAASKEITEHVKNGRWGDAAQALIGHLGKRAGEAAMGPAGELIKDSATNLYTHAKKAGEAAAQGDTAGAVENVAEAIPVLGPVGEQVGKPLASDIASGNTYGIVGDVAGAIPAVLGTAKMGAEGLVAPGEAAEAAIPKNPEVARTELPRSVGQAAADVAPTGIGSDIKGVEDVARKIPGSESLRDISTKQQAGARDILANKAKLATGAETSNAPEAIEQNAANAAEVAKKAGSAKYEELGKAAEGADLTKPVEAAHSILTDDNLAKVLPKSARDALGKVASALSEKEEISQQIYGKPFADLDPAKQAEVGKAMGSNPDGGTGFDKVLKARSELGAAANSARDAADARLLHQAHDAFTDATTQSIADLDKANGTSHAETLGEADKLWSQKYAFESFRDRLQSMMRDQPHTGNRLIDGSDFQKMINDMDPRGAKGKTELQRMFPDDPQSVKDMHDLADFMGKNQAGAGGMASSFAKLRILGLKETALGLIANTVGFSWLLSKPGLARAMLTVFKTASQGGRAAAAVAALNNQADEIKNQQENSGQQIDKNGLTQEQSTHSDGTGFQRPELEEHKRAGMAAAAEAPNTPNHLRPHLRKLAGTSVPEKGTIVLLPDGKRATVEYASPHDRLPIVRVRTPDAKVYRYTRQRDIDALRSVSENAK